MNAFATVLRPSAIGAVLGPKALGVLNFGEAIQLVSAPGDIGDFVRGLLGVESHTGLSQAGQIAIGFLRPVLTKACPPLGLVLGARDIFSAVQNLSKGDFIEAAQCLFSALTGFSGSKVIPKAVLSAASQRAVARNVKRLNYYQNKGFLASSELSNIVSDFQKANPAHSNTPIEQLVLIMRRQPEYRTRIRAAYKELPSTAPHASTAPSASRTSETSTLSTEDHALAAHEASFADLARQAAVNVSHLGQEAFREARRLFAMPKNLATIATS